MIQQLIGICNSASPLKSYDHEFHTKEQVVIATAWIENIYICKSHAQVTAFLNQEIISSSTRRNPSMV